MKTYKYLNAEIVAVIDEDGVSRCSMLAAAVPDGETILPADPPTPEELAQEAQRVEDEAAKTEAKADNVIQQLVGIKTLAQCNTFCTNRFPSLTAPEQAVMAKIVFALSVLTKQSLR